MGVNKIYTIIVMCVLLLCSFDYIFLYSNYFFNIYIFFFISNMKQSKTAHDENVFFLANWSCGRLNQRMHYYQG